MKSLLAFIKNLGESPTKQDKPVDLGSVEMKIHSWNKRLEEVNKIILNIKENLLNNAGVDLDFYLKFEETILTGGFTLKSDSNLGFYCNYLWGYESEDVELVMSNLTIKYNCSRYCNQYYPYIDPPGYDVKLDFYWRGTFGSEIFESLFAQLLGYMWEYKILSDSVANQEYGKKLTKKHKERIKNLRDEFTYSK